MSRRPGESLLRIAGAVQGKGDEVHQIAGGDVPTLTTQQGIPVSDDQNSSKVGPRGPTTLEDFHLREKIFHFDHERIPERVVHARGYGEHGRAYQAEWDQADWANALVRLSDGKQVCAGHYQRQAFESP